MKRGTTCLPSLAVGRFAASQLRRLVSGRSGSALARRAGAVVSTGAWVLACWMAVSLTVWAVLTGWVRSGPQLLLRKLRRATGPDRPPSARPSDPQPCNGCCRASVLPGRWPGFVPRSRTRHHPAGPAVQGGVGDEG